MDVFSNCRTVLMLVGGGRCQRPALSLVFPNRGQIYIHHHFICDRRPTCGTDGLLRSEGQTGNKGVCCLVLFEQDEFGM